MAVEGQGWERIAEVGKALERQRGVTVRAAGFLAAVRLAESLAVALHADWLIDGSWDPVRTVRNSEDLEMLNDRSLLEFSASWPVQMVNLPSDFLSSTDELEPQCSQRLRSALHTPYPGFQVVLTSTSSLLLIVTLITAQAGQQAAMLEIAYDKGLPRIATWLRNHEEIEEFLLNGKSRESQSGTSSVQNSLLAPIFPRSEGKAAFLGPLKLVHTEEIPQRVITEIRKIISEFEINLRKRLKWDETKSLKLAEIRTNIAEKAQKWKRELDESVNSVLKQTKLLEAARDSLKNELIAMDRDLEEASSAENQLKRLVLAVSTAFPAFLDPIPLKLQGAEQNLAEQKSILADLLSEKRTKKPLFALSPVLVKQNSALTTTVTCSKSYNVEGKLSILGPDGEIEWRHLDLNTGAEVELGLVMQCKTGLYQVSVTRENAIVSNVVTFTVNESHSLPKPAKSPSSKEAYLSSLLYTSLGTIEDIEHQIVEKARVRGLASFRKFAATWANADSSRIQEFLEVCLQSLPAGEGEARTQLESRGFQFLLA